MKPLRLPRPAVLRFSLPCPTVLRLTLPRFSVLRLALLLPTLVSLTASAAEGAHRHSAPIAVTQPGAFV